MQRSHNLSHFFGPHEALTTVKTLALQPNARVRWSKMNALGHQTQVMSAQLTRREPSSSAARPKTMCF
jgi:hypothetical protein